MSRFYRLIPALVIAAVLWIPIAYGIRILRGPGEAHAPPGVAPPAAATAAPAPIPTVASPSIQMFCYTQPGAKICYQLDENVTQLTVTAKDGEHVIFEKKEAAE